MDAAAASVLTKLATTPNGRPSKLNILIELNSQSVNPSIRQSIPINLRLTDWIDAIITSGRIGLIEVASLNQVQSIRQSGLIVDNCVGQTVGVCELRPVQILEDMRAPSLYVYCKDACIVRV